ncbi:MAG: secretory subunit [Geoglossum umbratile]|nr:MAG: secretory subunit [Geoglossum umbratile]
MSTEYNYDEQGQFFPYFILTITGLITFPLTYSLLKPSKDPENTAPRIHSDFKPPHADLVEGQKRKQKRRERKLKRMIAVTVGYLLMGYMLYLIAVTAKTIPKIWDPYDILGISRSSTEGQIKSYYKGLALKYHPDKIKPNPALNETIELLNERFSEMTKAFKALTDEEIRNNYIQYGHPDGKQSFSMSIALPKFLISGGNGKYVLAVYGLLLGVLLPYIVGKWWYGTQSVTKEGVLIASAGNLFREYEDKINEGGIVYALSSGEELKQCLERDRAEYGLAKIEGRILAKDETGVSRGLTEKEGKKLDDLDSGVRRKALGLLWAYLGRVELGDPVLEDGMEKAEVAPIAYALNESFTTVALAYCNTEPILSSFRTTQNIIQAMPPNSSPLLQLPYITERIARTIEGGSRSHMTVQQFMGFKDEKRRKIAVGQGLLTESQYNTAITVAKQLPLLRVEKAFFKVMGERFITPGSLVQFVVKARIVPPGATPPEVNELDLEDIDPEEDDLDALHGRKKSGKSKDGKKATANDKPSLPPLAHAPYYARDHSPRWFVFLADNKQGKMVVPPFTIVSLDKEIFDEQGNQTFSMQTLKMQFQAPPQAGEYPFVMHLLSDSYVGMDTEMDVTLTVDETAKAEKMAAEDEISEPDEDSLAGQMNALKAGSIGAPSKKSKKKTKEETSDDESDTEGEEEEASDTDTDTDTDTDGE